MLIGVPKEIKVRESRVGLVPNSVAELVGRGHRVMVYKPKPAQHKIPGKADCGFGL